MEVKINPKNGGSSSSNFNRRSSSVIPDVEIIGKKVKINPKINLKTSTQSVALEFAIKYFTTLLASPNKIFNLYEEDGGISSSNLPTLKLRASEGTNFEIKSMYDFDKVKVLNIDAQPSVDNGVMVLIIGFLSTESVSESFFIQTLFLVKNAKRYLIWNDILKFAFKYPNALATFTVVANEVTENNSATPLTEEDKVMATGEINPPKVFDFVKKYYGILLRSPSKIYGFYADSNKNRTLNLDRDRSTPSAMHGMLNPDLLTEYKFNKVNLDIDAQPSVNNGVIVLITGFLIGEGNKKRSFIQTLFLDINDEGYIVISNDIFKFATEFDKGVAAVVANEAEAKQIKPFRMPKLSPFLDSILFVQPPSANSYLQYLELKTTPTPAEKKTPPPPQQEEPNAPPPLRRNNPSSKQSNISDKNQAQEQQPKPSYASMEAKGGSSVTSHITPPPAEEKTLPPPQLAPTPRHGHSEGKGIYVGNLPPYISSEEVRKAFETYGKVREDGVYLKKKIYPVGICYGFVEFETLDAARKAIKARTFWFGTHRSYVAKKKSPFQVSNGNCGQNRGSINKKHKRPRV